VVEGAFTSVDVRYRFPLHGDAGSPALVAVTGPSQVFFFTLQLDAGVPQLSAATSALTPIFVTSATCVNLWHPPGSNVYEAFVWSPGGLGQYSIFDDGAGAVAGALQNQFPVAAGAMPVTGCASDERNGLLWATSLGDGGLLGDFLDGGAGVESFVDAGAQLGFKPTAGVAVVELTTGTAHLVGVPNGAPDASFSAPDASVVFVFTPVGSAFSVESFEVVGADGGRVSGAMGLSATAFGLGPAFPNGLLVLSDNSLGDGGDFKLVALPPLGAALDPRLEGLLPDGGLPFTDGGVSPTGDGGTSSPHDGGAGGVGSGGPGAGAGGSSSKNGGCACQATGSGAWGLLLGGAFALWQGRRRRRL
jgi:MYXO-CTERM domain-containing protein